MRALVVAADGRVLARAARALTTRFPAPGRVEQDASEMWERSVAVMREALSVAGLRAGSIAGLGVVSQRGTAVAWRSDDLEPLAPAISWQDRRTADRCAELARAGLPIDTLATATKLEWWLRHEPAVRAAADAGRLRLGTPDAWLSARLTRGEAVVTDPGSAGATALYDARRGIWAPALLAHLGIDAAWLPAIAPTAAACGATPPALLGAPVPVAARAGDQQAACFAQGVHREGDAKLTLGTSAMLDVHTGERMRRPPRGAWPLPLWQLPGRPLESCLEGSVVTAGAALDWLVSIGLLPDASALDAVAGSVASTAGVVFVPALQGLGTPYADPLARGLVGGLTRGSGRGEIARALVEGIADRCADLVEALPVGPGPLRVDGGLARSDLLLATLADRIGRPVHRAAETETTALGAAFLAGLATGVLPEPGDVVRRIGAPRAFEPVATPAQRATARARWRRVLERSGPGGPAAGSGGDGP